MVAEIHGPTKNQIKKYILEKTLVSFKMINEETIKGKVLWHDQTAFHIETEDKAKITLYNQSILYYFACE